MIEAWATALEATELAGALRGSVWAYPLVNAGHLLGVALLIGAIVPLDLRLLGVWPGVSLAPLWRVLTRTAGVGLGIAVVCGVLLFITRAAEYADSSLFVIKMGAVGIGMANALVVRLAVSDERLTAEGAEFSPPAGIRAAAGVSLAAWLGALTLGRLIGYF